MGIPDHLTCLLRNLYAGQEATVWTGHGTTDWFQTGKGVHQGCILLCCLFNLYAGYIMRNPGLDEAQTGIKVARRNINNQRYADDTNLWQKVKRNWKASWWKWKGRVKSWLKAQHSENWDHGLQFYHLMANRWRNSGTVTKFIFVGSKVSVDGDCSHDIKICLLLGRKAMAKLDSISKSRDITLLTLHL